MHVLAFLLVFYCFSVVGQTNLDVGGIKAVRFAAGSNRFIEDRDGVLEVNYNGTWGTICNFGFDEISASVACFMLGYPPRGVALLNNKATSPLPLILSNFNCTGRVLLPNSIENTATMHLGVCSFAYDLPVACSTPERQTSIYCLDPLKETSTVTPIPDFSPVAPVNCSIPTKSVRLVDGTSSSGRVEIQHPETKVWGTICADDFNANAAKAICRMLCVSDDNLQYAYPTLYQFGSASDEVPIHLTRIHCPANATGLSDCDLGGGWGSTAGCTHGMDVGLICGPVSHTENRSEKNSPEFECNQTSGVVRYNKTLNPDLNASMIRLRGEVPIGCQFQALDLEEVIEVVVPLFGCGGSLKLSNSTSIAINLDLVREYIAPENGIISNLPEQFSITCLIPRSNQINSVPVVASQVFHPNLLGKSAVIRSELNLFRDPQFSRQLNLPIQIAPGQKVYTLVSLINPQATSKLIVDNCWATANPDGHSLPKQLLISNRCAVFPNLTVLPLSNTQVGFTFANFYLGEANTKVPLTANLYLHCSTRVCDLREQTTQCQQFCSAPTITSSMTKRRYKRTTDKSFFKGFVTIQRADVDDQKS